MSIGRLALAISLAAPTPAPRLAGAKELRWYVGQPSYVASILAPGATNPRHLLNTSLAFGDVSRALYQCCEFSYILPSGSLHNTGYATPAGWAKATAAYGPGVEWFATIALTTNCSQAAQPQQACWSAGDTCRAALRRGPAFTAELMAFLQAYDLRGINLDWEFPTDNDVHCHEQLWGAASKAMRAAGRQLAISVDDSMATPFNASATVGSWTFDWKFFLPYADFLINVCAPIPPHPTPPAAHSS